MVEVRTLRGHACGPMQDFLLGGGSLQSEDNPGLLKVAKFCPFCGSELGRALAVEEPTQPFPDEEPCGTCGWLQEKVDGKLACINTGCPKGPKPQPAPEKQTA